MHGRVSGVGAVLVLAVAVVLVWQHAHWQHSCSRVSGGGLCVCACVCVVETKCYSNYKGCSGRSAAPQASGRQRGCMHAMHARQCVCDVQKEGYRARCSGARAGSRQIRKETVLLRSKRSQQRTRSARCTYGCLLLSFSMSTQGHANVRVLLLEVCCCQKQAGCSWPGRPLAGPGSGSGSARRLPPARAHAAERCSGRACMASTVNQQHMRMRGPLAHCCGPCMHVCTRTGLPPPPVTTAAAAARALRAEARGVRSTRCCCQRDYVQSGRQHNKLLRTHPFVKGAVSGNVGAGMTFGRRLLPRFWGVKIKTSVGAIGPGRAGKRLVTIQGACWSVHG